MLPTPQQTPASAAAPATAASATSTNTSARSTAARHGHSRHVCYRSLHIGMCKHVTCHSATASLQLTAKDGFGYRSNPSDNLQRRLFNVNPARLIVTVLLMEIFIVIIIISDNDIITNFSYR